MFTNLCISGYILVCETETHQQEKRPTMTKEKQRFEGHCQYCCNQQRLTSENKLVHHGFERPGDGMIHDDCNGVGELPIELDITLANNYLKELQDQLYDTKHNVENCKVALSTLETSLRLTMPKMENIYEEFRFLANNEEYVKLDKLHYDYARQVYPLEMFIARLTGAIERNHGKPIIDFMEAENRRKVELSQRPEKVKFGNWKYSKSRYEVTNSYSYSSNVRLEEYTEDSLRAFKRPNADILADFAEALDSSKGCKRMTDRIFIKMTNDLEAMLNYLGVK